MTGNFENSYLGNIIGVQRQKMQDFTNSRLRKVKQMNQRATNTINQRRAKSRSYNARLMAKHGYDIARALAKQKELVNKGYKLAIDGDWGVNKVKLLGRVIKNRNSRNYKMRIMLDLIKLHQLQN